MRSSDYACRRDRMRSAALRAFGYLFRVCGAILSVGMVLLWWTARSKLPAYGFMPHLLIIFCLIAALSLGGWLFRLGRPFLVAGRPIPFRSADVVIFRSFRDDKAQAPEHWGYLLFRHLTPHKIIASAKGALSPRSFLQGILRFRVNRIPSAFLGAFKSLRSFVLDILHLRESHFLSMLSDALARKGNVVAIGDPRAALPYWAASWFYFDDALWKESALRFVKEAKVVVLVLGTTQSLQWEIGQVVTKASEKVIFILPPSPFERGWEERRDHFGKACEEAGVSLSLEGIPPHTMVFRLDRDMQPVFYGSEGQTLSDYRTTVASALNDLPDGRS